jgi:hypothetical protein
MSKEVFVKPIAHFDWQMPSRAQIWAQAWDTQAARYHDDYVSPKKWRVILDAGKSDGGGSEIARYRWEIQGLDQINFAVIKEIRAGVQVRDHTTLGEGTYVGPIADKVLPSLGRYRVTITVTNKNGEKSDPVSGVINLQDLLVVSIGDSMASGEGNPDKERMPVVIQVPDTGIPIPGRFTDPVWTDRRCHRSQHSGHAQAALKLESSHRSVTFLSFACSGASLQSGLGGTYVGMEKPTGQQPERLPSQIDAVADAIGDNRTIDMLWITAGLNELGDDGFSSVIKTFALPHPINWSASDDMKELVTNQLSTMPDKYNHLAWALSSRLHGRVRQVFITEYPADIFQPTLALVAVPPHLDRSGCGELSLIDDGEGTFIFEKGNEFNQIIQRTAQFHGWGFISGIVKAFDGYGYCNDPSFYVGREESKSKQGNEDGTIHPNSRGQEAIRDRIWETTRTSTPVVHHSRQVTVRFNQVQGSALVEPGKDVILILKANEQEIAAGGSDITGNPRHSGGSVTFFVDDGLAGPLVGLSGELISEGTVDGDFRRRKLAFPQRFGPADNLGEGDHVAKFPDLEVHYSISVKPENVDWLEPVLHVMMS